MEFNFRARKGRILVRVTDVEDRIKILSMHCEPKRDKNNPDIYSIEDTLVNRIAFGIDGLPGESRLYNRDRAPDDLEETLRDIGLKEFQVNDVVKSWHLNAVLNTNKMGYGKTVEALVYARVRKARTLLIICPKTIRYQWADQVRKWFDPDAEILISPRSIKSLVQYFERPTVIITNYEQLNNPNTLESFKSLLWDCLIVDEAHRIKNAKSKVTCNIKSLPATLKVALTGTPIMRKPDDLWSILHFLDPTIAGGSYWGFVYRFCEVEDSYFGKQIRGLTRSPERIELLKKVLSIIMIRNEAQMTPPVMESEVVLEMYPKQRQLYNSVKYLAYKELDKANVTIASGLGQCIKLQQLVSCPSIFEPLKAVKNIKFEWILDMLTDNPEVKVVVFTRYKTTVYQLASLLEDHDIDTRVITGDVTETDREVAKMDFIERAQVRVLCGTIGAISESIDGLQRVSNLAIFVDKDWNPETNNQAIGRLARIGQKASNVQVFSLVCKDSIDEKVGKVNIEKIKDIRTLIN